MCNFILNPWTSASRNMPLSSAFSSDPILTTLSLITVVVVDIGSEWVSSADWLWLVITGTLMSQVETI